MDNTNKYFQGQQRNEQIVYYTRTHWVTLLPLAVEGIAIALITAGMIALGVISKGPTAFGQTVAVMILIALTIWIHSIFVRLMNYFLGIVIVTNFRIIRMEKTLYLRNDKNVVDLHEIQDIKKSQHGIVPNLLNYGRLVVVVPTMIEPMILHSIPNPDKFFRKVNNAKRDYIHHRQQQRLSAMSSTTNTTLEPLTNAISRAT